VIVHDNAENVFQQAAAFRGDTVKRQPDGRGDVQPLRLAANPEAGFVPMPDRCRRHMVAHGGGETLETHGTTTGHAGDGRRHQVYAEQIRHQRGKPLLGQHLIVRQIDHHREARPISHRRGHVFGKRRARFGAAIRATAGTRAVFRDNQWLRFGEVEHLSRGMARGDYSGQDAAAARTGLGEMVRDVIGGFDAAQLLAGVAFLSAGLHARAFAKAMHAEWFLLQPTARWRLAAVAAVQSKPTLQFGVPRL